MILVRIGEQCVHHATHITSTLRKVRVQAKYGGNGVNDDQSNAVLLQQLGQVIVNAIEQRLLWVEVETKGLGSVQSGVYLLLLLLTLSY